MLSDPQSRYHKRRPRRGPRDRVAEALLALAEDTAVILDHEEKSWASITFAGSQHRVGLLFEGNAAIEAAERFIIAFPDHEFVLPGQLVVDAAITVVEHRLDPPRMRVFVEAMLVEQG